MSVIAMGRLFSLASELTDGSKKTVELKNSCPGIRFIFRRGRASPRQAQW